MRIAWGWGLVAVGVLLGAAGAVLFERPIMLALGAVPVAIGATMIRSGYRSGLRD
ncbi:hypothetical protein [Arenivirga flava]|uniref:Uncharacterized protein n=1 Tax=Arenivirga flava TaxID=1930060 RepID=A0AA37XBG6_9MICO|nr:hypothetical protein [Arenivirga flava]GMA28636.1 hypothetical protein GCM10025874_18890 [Arenivirga flava]